MMNESESRKALENLAKKYLQADPDLQNLINIINDETRPGLPVRGILESIRNYRTVEISEADKDVIEELIYLYG